MAGLRRNNFIISGVVCILCFPFLLIVAGMWSRFLPREYFSKATVELKGASDYEYHQALMKALGRLGAAGEIRDIRQTDLKEIGAFDTDPVQAARKANEAAETLRQTSQFPVKIWEKAEPAMDPSLPRVGFILLCAGGVGLLCATVGVALIVFGLIRPKPPLMQGA